MGFDHKRQNVFMKECEVVLENCIVANVDEERSSVFVIKMNMRNVLSKETRER